MSTQRLRCAVDPSLGDLYLFQSGRAGPVAAQSRRLRRPGNEQRLALVIGNSSYKDSPLANPANDAQDIAKALADLGFKVHTAHQCPSASHEAGNTRVRSAVETGRGGSVLFAATAFRQGRNYLVPVGANISGEADLEDESVDSNLVLAHMEDAQNRVNIVVLDACRNNPFARSFRSAARGLAQVDAARGNFIAFATAPGQVANDGTGRNGTYTKHLLQSLRQSGSDLERVFKRVAAGVAQETSGKQGALGFVIAHRGISIFAPRTPAPWASLLQLHYRRRRRPWSICSQWNSLFGTRSRTAPIRATSRPISTSFRMAASPPWRGHARNRRQRRLSTLP